METIDISHSNEIYSVSQLNREARFLLESSFPAIWIEGEISNFTSPYSGHWYFSLKDSLAQVRCAMFRMQNQYVNFLLRDGMQVLIKARISLYEGRGDFQLLVDHIEEAGEGKLRQAFEALKKRLQAMGLFEETHKKTLPHLPQTIGVITSATGAAIRDILSVLQRRFACAKVIIYPTLVQGESAAFDIVHAIETAQRRNECDVLILARGGGSLEDLWPFNEEIVALAIFACVIPIISGVGHEIDFTIADFVADRRAPTPSAAAELVVPDLKEMVESLDDDEKYFLRLIKQKIHQWQQHLNWVAKHIQQQHPQHRLRTQTQRLDLYEVALIRLQHQLLSTYQIQLQTLKAKLFGVTPKHKIQERQRQLIHDMKQLSHQINNLLQKKQQRLANAATKLDALSPLSTLQRGFAIVSQDDHIVTRSREVKKGDKVKVQLKEGQLICQIEKLC